MVAGTIGIALACGLSVSLAVAQTPSGSRLDEVMKSKGCGCKAGTCPSAPPWSTMPFIVKGGACGAKDVAQRTS